jgi:hypothetical protein
MNNTINLYFDAPMIFEPNNIRPLSGIAGLYFIFNKTISIQYPFEKSKLIYIGMSEKKTNSIGSRLSGHYDGSSRNLGLVNYRKVEPLFFTYLNFDILKTDWNYRIEDLESYFIMDFVKQYGVYPICNNKSGFEILKSELQTNFKIDWSYFK